MCAIFKEIPYIKVFFSCFLLASKSDKILKIPFGDNMKKRKLHMQGVVYITTIFALFLRIITSNSRNHLRFSRKKVSSKKTFSVLKKDLDSTIFTLSCYWNVTSMHVLKRNGCPFNQDWKVEKVGIFIGKAESFTCGLTLLPAAFLFFL